jgi:hypothetical protein
MAHTDHAGATEFRGFEKSCPASSSSRRTLNPVPFLILPNFSVGDANTCLQRLCDTDV